MSLRLIPISSMPWPGKTSSMGPACACTSISIDALVELAGAELGAELVPGGVARGVGRDLLEGAARRTARPARRGSRRSSSRSSARLSARSRTAAAISAFTMVTASSVRSRIIDSTSRPT